MVRQRHLIAVVVTFLIGCAVLLVVGCSSGVRSEAPQEKQGHSEVTKEQAHSPEATASEVVQCGETRYVTMISARYTTNDVPGCPNKGGLLSGTDGPDRLAGREGDDEIRGLGSSGRSFDELLGGSGSDVLYGESGMDFLAGGEGDDVLYGGGDSDDLFGTEGEDVLHGGGGNDYLDGRDEGPKDSQPDEIYCGAGRDKAIAGKYDSVSSSCEEKVNPPRGSGRIRVD